MGLFKKSMKAALLSSAKSKPKKTPASKPDMGDVDVFMQGTAPPPATGAPYIAKLKTGKQIVLQVSTNHATNEAMKRLLGKPKEDGDFVERSVRALMFRDLQSTYPDSVRIETLKGELVGWVIKPNSYYACELINQVGEHLDQDPTLRGRAPRCNVSLYVEGTWNEDEEDGWVPDLENAEVRIFAPVYVEEFDPLTPAS